MYSFIPSWYGDKGDWQGSISSWHEAGCSYEFDDTVNHLRMFRDAGEETELLCLGWSPRLRRFLHRQGLYPVSCWSAFDELQGITLRKPAVFSYMELSWPEDTEWVYLPTHLSAYLGNQHYADVEFAEDGTLCRVDYYADGCPARSDMYDDRGFCSASVFYGSPNGSSNGTEPDNSGAVLPRQEYYDPSGHLRFTQELETGRIRIAREAAADFAKDAYDSMEELIGERLARYLSDHPEREALVIAADARHDAMIRRTLETIPGQRIVLSFFEDRFDLQDRKALLEDTRNAALIVTDTERTARQIRDAGVQDVNICDISPFDVRLSLGKSQQIRELKIFMPLDGLEGVLLEKALQQVFSYMHRNKDVVLLAGTRAGSISELEALQTQLEEVLQAMGDRELRTALSVRKTQKERTERTENGEAARILVTPYHSETDLIRILRDTRLILDVRDQPELYLQIAGISSGIPQVNYRFTRYVKHKKDGYIIQNINYITGALEYYLDSLSGWNEALVYCVQAVSEYTGGTLVKRWKEMLHAVAEQE